MFRAIYHRLLAKLFSSYRFRQELDDVLPRLARSSASTAHRPSYLQPPDQGRVPPESTRLEAAGRRAIFITARFRSGSTLLWRIFTGLGGFSAYYEPLNENRWFAGGQTHAVDPSHVGVVDYALGYEGMADLAALFDDTWGHRNLYMDEGSFDWNLYRYIGELVRRAPQPPVLQFNRIDFRLPWVRRYFPQAKILHLHRSPRTQWLSVLGDLRANSRITLSQFRAHDRFYLMPWLRDLSQVFPLLDLPEREPAYLGHYLLYRLSYLYAQEFAHTSISYEALVTEPIGVMQSALQALKLDLPDGAIDWPGIAGLVKSGEAEPVAADRWFDGIEREAEALLAAYLRK